MSYTEILTALNPTSKPLQNGMMTAFIPWINTHASLSRSLAWPKFIPLALSPTLVLFTVWEAAELFPEPFLHFDVDRSVFSGA